MAVARRPDGSDGSPTRRSLQLRRSDREHLGPAAASGLYGRMIEELLPLLPWRGIERDDRLYRLSTHAGALARDGAAATLADDRPGDALRQLDQGRAFLWNQALELRTDLSHLEAVDSDLAHRLTECRRAIDHLDTLALRRT